MTISKDLHKIQMSILKKLTFSNGMHFSEINSDNYPSDQFSFHISKLLENELISKSSDGIYALTNAGKDFVRLMDTDSSTMEKQAKISVRIILRRQKTDGTWEYLLNRRLKHPYYGYIGFIGGKARFGEKFEDAAKRELFEETGIIVSALSLIQIEHKLHISTEKVVEDTLFARFLGEYNGSDYKKAFEEGENVWKTLSELKNDTKKFQNMFDCLQSLECNSVRFYQEVEILADGY